METPEKLRATALMLFDMANRTASFQRQEELIARAERLERKARDIEEAETDHDARIRITDQLLTETDSVTLSQLRASLDNLEE